MTKKLLVAGLNAVAANGKTSLCREEFVDLICNHGAKKVSDYQVEIDSVEYTILSDYGDEDQFRDSRIVFSLCAVTSTHVLTADYIEHKNPDGTCEIRMINEGIGLLPEGFTADELLATKRPFFKDTKKEAVLLCIRGKDSKEVLIHVPADWEEDRD